MRARLLSIRDLAPGIRHFVFEVPEMEQFQFTPGQFVSCVAEIDGRQITRAYSVVAPPSGNRFELCLNRVQEGRFSPFLFDLTPGREVQCSGPFGTFVWREPPADSVLVATGTGIAPIRGMLLERLPHDADRQYTLIFGVRYEPNLLYREDFERLAREHPNFQFLPTLSRPGENWTGRTGHVQNHLFEVIGGRRDLRVYVCGLKAMVDDVRQRLKDAGFDRKQIVYEKYD